MLCATSKTSAAARVLRHRSRRASTGATRSNGAITAGGQPSRSNGVRWTTAHPRMRRDASRPALYRLCTSTISRSATTVCRDCDADASVGSPTLPSDELVVCDSGGFLHAAPRSGNSGTAQNPPPDRLSGINQKIDWSDHISIQSVGTGDRAPVRARVSHSRETRESLVAFCLLSLYGGPDAGLTDVWIG